MERASPSPGVQADGLSYLETPEHKDVAALAAYWESKRAGRAMPDRANIDPAEIVRLLPNIFICEVLDGGREYRFRIFGTALVDILGREMTGMRLAEMESAILTDASAAIARWRAITDRAWRTARPVFATGQLVNTIHSTVSWHSFAAPLTLGNDAAGQIFGGFFCDALR